MMVYKLVNPINGAVIVSGSGRECAEFLGFDPKTVYNAERERKQVHLRLDVYKADEHHDAVSPAEEWEAFMQPLREKYGIAVKRMDPKR